MRLEQEKKLFDGITNICDEITEDALDTQLKVHRPKWKTWGTVAACAVVAIGISGALVLQNLQLFGGSGGSGHPEGSSTFMSYAGPVFPLTLHGADDSIIATRNITYDFALTNDEDLRVWGSDVTDSYTLHNTSTDDKTITAIYPFAGSFNELSQQMLTITVEEQQISPALHAGSFCGGFTGAFGSDNPNGSENILQLSSWEGYKALLEDGSYQNAAFLPYSVLSQQVTIYTFTDLNAPLEDYDAATQAISFTIVPDKTTILSYGFNGGEWDDNGFRRYSYFVPDDMRMESDTKMLIVLGDDITDYSLQGYKNGACEKGNELDGVSVTVTRSQDVMSDVMDRLIDAYFAQYGDGNTQAVSDELYLGAASEFLLQYGLLSDSTRDRYQDGMLEDIISEMNNLQRVLYLEFSVTILAGESVSATAVIHKNPSYDFACSGSDSVGIQGYDMVTRLGSNLDFTELTAELYNTELIEIVRQNFGFDLGSGVAKVTLDPDIEHYYLEIRSVEKDISNRKTY